MLFNFGVNSLYDDARYQLGISTSDTTTYNTTDFARNANIGMDEVIALIFQSDNKWEYDDNNETDEPIATTTLVSGQQDYSIATTHLKIVRVRVKDSAGNWKTLRPVDRRELPDWLLTQSNGSPQYYDKLGTSLFLYPAPDYGSSGGLEVQYQRGAVYFAASDTSVSPGFASPFHRLISLIAAREYASVNDMGKKLAMIEGKIQDLSGKLVIFYSDRDRDQHQSIKLLKTDYGEVGMSNSSKITNNPDKFYV